MGRLFYLLLVLFAAYFGFQFIFNMYSKGFEENYELINQQYTYTIYEKYAANTKGEDNNYYLEIEVDNKIFNFETYENFYGSSKIITNAHYVNDKNVSCLWPTFKTNKILTDIICLTDNIQTPLHKLSNQSDKVKLFAKEMEEFGYKKELWVDNVIDMATSHTTNVYTKNIPENHYLAVNNYRGLYTINNTNLKKLYDIKLFSFDTYKRPLSATVDKYYITADYSQKYAFDKIYVVDLTNNRVDEINTRDKIEFDSYVQGTVDGSLYIYDRYNKKQYQVMTKTKSVVEVGNETTGIKYYENGVWSRISAFDAAKTDYLFDTKETLKENGYVRVDKVGGELSGYYYYFKKVGNNYQVFRAPIQNNAIKTYLFTTNKIGDVLYIRDYVYYTNNNNVSYYHDKTGSRTLFNNSEFNFNNSLYFSVYSK